MTLHPPVEIAAHCSHILQPLIEAHYRAKLLQAYGDLSVFYHSVIGLKASMAVYDTMSGCQFSLSSIDYSSNFLPFALSDPTKTVSSRLCGSG